MTTLYVVVEYYKMSRLGEVAVFDSKAEAEEFIKACFASETLDYKTTFSIEETGDECAH